MKDVQAMPNPERPMFKSLPGLGWIFESIVKKLLSEPRSERGVIVLQAAEYHIREMSKFRLMTIGVLFAPFLANAIAAPVMSLIMGEGPDLVRVASGTVDLVKSASLVMVIPLAVFHVFHFESLRVQRWLLATGLPAMEELTGDSDNV